MNNAVLIAEDDWRAIQETLYLDSFPGMRQSILEGMQEPLPDRGVDRSEVALT
jgi:PHD/YefM family antitoxin component YafN of YafNO toxin-antitoxin module